jgi:hypothetical protein
MQIQTATAAQIAERMGTEATNQEGAAMRDLLLAVAPPPLAAAAAELDAVDAREHEVQQDQIGPAVSDGPQAFFSRGRPENLVPFFFQVILEQFPDILFILHHQNVGPGPLHGVCLLPDGLEPLSLHTPGRRRGKAKVL